MHLYLGYMIAVKGAKQEFWHQRKIVEIKYNNI